MIYNSLSRTYNYLLRTNAVNQYSLITEPNGTTYAQVHDADGNLTDSYTTQYTYDAFGRTISSSGADADNFTYRFSTKPLDGNGLYYYGYRYYDPQHGRWISRDPLEEEGGVNLYGFVGNNGINNTDFLGMRVLFFGKDDGDSDLKPHGLMFIYWGCSQDEIERLTVLHWATSFSSTSKFQ